MSKSLPTSLIQISSRCKSLSAGQGVSGVTRSPGLPCQEGLSRGSRLAQLVCICGHYEKLLKEFRTEMSYRREAFCAARRRGVWPHQHETQHTPAGRRGGAAPAAGWRFGSCSAPPCFMRTWPPFIYVFS